MHRLPAAIAALSFLVLLPGLARAQSIGCEVVPNGPPMDIQVEVAPRTGGTNSFGPRSRVIVGMQGVPAYGETCITPDELPEDTLRGDPPGRRSDVLHGDTGRDVLSGRPIARPTGRVTVTPASRAPALDPNRTLGGTP